MGNKQLQAGSIDPSLFSTLTKKQSNQTSYLGQTSHDHSLNAAFVQKRSKSLYKPRRNKGLSLTQNSGNLAPVEKPANITHFDIGHKPKKTNSGEQVLHPKRHASSAIQAALVNPSSLNIPTKKPSSEVVSKSSSQPIKDQDKSPSSVGPVKQKTSGQVAIVTKTIEKQAPQADESSDENSSISGESFDYNPTREMNSRYSSFVKSMLPEQDFQRLEINQKLSKAQAVIMREFSSECAHNSFLHALYRQSWAIGDYTQNKKLCSSSKRHRYIVFIMQLVQRKKYKIETLFHAISIFDRYVKLKRTRLDFGSVSIVSVLMAAKLEQPVIPSFEIILDLVPTCQLTVEELIAEESRILSTLQFDVQWATPVVFAERYVMVSGFDDDFMSVVWLVLKLMSSNSALWLDYHPSLQAAVAFVLSVNFNQEKQKVKGGVEVWTDELQALTRIQRADLADLYQACKATINPKEILADQ